jgi:serine/threonine-protein kinase
MARNPTAESLPTRTIGSFEVEDELGHGGMGVVYLARQPALERRVVLKTLRRDLAERPNIDERFTREAQAAAALHHPNVVAVYDCFSWRGARYIAQEYVHGADLHGVLEKVSRIQPRIAALISLELVRGLEEIHGRGFVHRDLKPSNILIGRGGEAKIADFGIALDAKAPALTQTGHAIGTPPYMSPEQYLGERVDGRSDLFSLGVVIYEMVTGKPPFEGGEPEEGPGLLRRMESEAYPSPREAASGTPRYLERLIRACLRAKPKKRLQSAKALRRSLERHLGSPAPVDCREEIAAWMWERKVFEASAEETAAMKKKARRRPVTREARVSKLRWAIAASATAAVVAGSLGRNRVEISKPDLAHTLQVGREVGAAVGDRLRELPERARRLSQLHSGRVSFELPAGTEVRVDGQAPLVTPQREPLALAPGLHGVEFRHPQLGQLRRTLVVSADQLLSVRDPIADTRE